MLDAGHASTRPDPIVVPPARPPLRPRTLTDVHCGLHRTRVAGVAVPGDLSDLRAALGRAGCGRRERGGHRCGGL